MLTVPGSRIIYVIDDDRDIRSSLAFQLRALGYEVHPFLGASDFLERLEELSPGAILMDVRMAEMDGVQAIAQLNQRGISWPVIMMTGHAEVALAVEVMRNGAVDFLEKPFEEARLQDALARSFAKFDQEQATSNERSEASRRLSRLTLREKEVLHRMVDGGSNKAIARSLDLSVRTVEMHRANLLAKLSVRTVAEAVMLASRALP